MDQRDNPSSPKNEPTLEPVDPFSAPPSSVAPAHGADSGDLPAWLTKPGDGAGASGGGRMWLWAGGLAGVIVLGAIGSNLLLQEHKADSTAEINRLGTQAEQAAAQAGAQGVPAAPAAVPVLPPRPSSPLPPLVLLPPEQGGKPVTQAPADTALVTQVTPNSEAAVAPVGATTVAPKVGGQAPAAVQQGARIIDETANQAAAAAPVPAPARPAAAPVAAPAKPAAVPVAAPSKPPVVQAPAPAPVTATTVPPVAAPVAKPAPVVPTAAPAANAAATPAVKPATKPATKPVAKSAAAKKKPSTAKKPKPANTKVKGTMLPAPREAAREREPETPVRRCIPGELARECEARLKQR